MARNPQDYLRLLQSLLPKGRAWTREAGSVLSQLLDGKAQIFASIEDRADQLLVERDTRTVSELLTEYEFEYDSPGDCLEIVTTVEERKSLVYQKVIALGGLNPAYIIELAAALGYTIVITEHAPFWCGMGGCGDPIGDGEALFTWTVSTSFSGETTYFRSGSGRSGDRLVGVTGSDLLQCFIDTVTPAHTKVFFDFAGGAFSSAFSTAFDSRTTSDTSYLTGEFSQGFGLGFDVNLGGAFDKDALEVSYSRSR